MIFVHLWWWFQAWTGGSNTSGVAYGEWSGFVSDLSEFVVVGGVVAWIRHKTCEVKGCWRIGRHTTDGGHHVCARHHPDGAPSASDVIRDHLQAKARKEEI